MILQTYQSSVTKSQSKQSKFINEFTEYAPNKFSQEGLRLLYRYLLSFKEQTGVTVDFDDVIGIELEYGERDCKEFYESIRYEDDFRSWFNPRSKVIKHAVRQYLEEKGAFVGFTYISTVVYCRSY